MKRPTVSSATTQVGREIHLWVPDLDNRRGGIEAFSAAMLSALSAIWRGEVFALGKHVLADSKLSHPANVRIAGTGCWPLRLRTGAFAAELLYQAVRRRPVLVICTHLHFAPLARLVRRLTGTPYWVVAHGIESWSLSGFGRIQALRQADQILAVSRFTRDRLAANAGLDGARVVLLPNCVDEVRFCPRPKSTVLIERHGIRADARIILTVGRLCDSERYKGYDHVIHILPELARAVPNVHYMLVGEGNDRPRIERLARACGVTDRVTFAGFIPAEELIDYYNLCDVFAMPSKGEGFGIVFLEALACGKPVLAGDRDGSVDPLLGGELGVVVDPDDESKIADALIQMLQGRHPLRILRDPAALRNRVIEAFGRASFQRRLGNCLALAHPNRSTVE